MSRFAPTQNQPIDHPLYGVSGQLVWQCRTKQMIEYFLNCHENDEISTDDIELSFDLNGETIKTQWYLEIAPNKKYNGTQFYLEHIEWPKPKSMEIVSFNIKRLYRIPEIGFQYNNSFDFGIND